MNTQALRGQGKMRKKTSAAQVQDMTGRLVPHRLREELINMNHRGIQGQARAGMTVNAQDVKGTSSGGLALPGSRERNPRTGRQGLEDRCWPPMTNIWITHRWSMQREIYMKDLLRRLTSLGGPSSWDTKRSYGDGRKSWEESTREGSLAKMRKWERTRQKQGGSCKGPRKEAEDWELEWGRTPKG